MSDKKWAFFAPFVTATGSKSGRPPEDHRRVLDGAFWIARTGAPWRDLHDYFGKWSTVYRQFRRWALAGIWELMLQALNESDGPPRSLQMIDSTIVRAHHQAAGASGCGSRRRRFPPGPSRPAARFSPGWRRRTAPAGRAPA
jgi:transposase